MNNSFWAKFKLANPLINALVFFTSSLVVFNIAFISSNGWARILWNSLGYLCLFIAFKAARLNLNKIGLSKIRLKVGLKYGGMVIAFFLTVMIIVYFIDKTAFKDPRYHHSFFRALYSVMLILPLKTIFFEELAFRGILPAIVLKIKSERRFATIVSALAFGLWHILSATKVGDYNLTSTIAVPNILVVLGIFIATSVIGYLFCELRWRSGSLVAPIVVHWFINGFGTLLAALSWY
jgi:membrane protease YdiL (CAAX protease family)